MEEVGSLNVDIRRFYKRHLRIFSYLPYFTKLNKLFVVGAYSLKEYILFTVSISIAIVLSMAIPLLYINLPLYIIYPITLAIASVTIVLSPIIFRYVAFDGLKRDLEREYVIFILIFSLYSRRFSLERIFQILSNSYISSMIPKTISIIKFLLVRTYLKLSTLDNIILNNLDVIAGDSLKSFFLDIVRIRAIGGSINSYVVSILNEYYKNLGERWRSIWRSITGYLEVIILIYGLMPALISSLVFVIGLNTAVTLLIISLVFYPIISYLIMAIVDRMNVLDPFSTKANFNRLSLVLLSLSPLAIYLLSDMYFNDYLISTSIWLAIALIPNTLVNIKDIVEEISIESGILMVTTQLEELLSGGYTVTQALKRVRLEGIANQVSIEIRRLLFSLDGGLPLDKFIGEEKVKALTLFKMALVESIKSGGGLNEFISLKELLKSFHRVSILRKISFLIATSTATIVVLMGVFSLSVVMNMVGSIEYNVLPSFNPAMFESLYFLSKLFLLTGAIYTCLILSKVLFGSIKNTISLETVLTVLSLAFLFIL